MSDYLVTKAMIDDQFDVVQCALGKLSKLVVALKKNAEDEAKENERLKDKIFKGGY